MFLLIKEDLLKRGPHLVRACIWANFSNSSSEPRERYTSNGFRNRLTFPFSGFEPLVFDE